MKTEPIIFSLKIMKSSNCSRTLKFQMRQKQAESIVAYSFVEWIINNCSSFAVFHLSKTSHISLFLLMQNDCWNCRRLKARHDKQHWGRLSAKCALTDSKPKLVLYFRITLFILTSLSDPHCLYECTHLHTQMNTQTYTSTLCMCSVARRSLHAFPNTHTHRVAHTSGQYEKCML